MNYFRRFYAVLILLCLAENLAFADGGTVDFDSATFNDKNTSSMYAGSDTLRLSSSTAFASYAASIFLPSSVGSVDSMYKPSVSYSAETSNGLVGTKWTLNTGFIYKLKKFAPNSPSNPYCIEINGAATELVAVSATEYRTKQDQHWIIQKSATQWLVSMPDGSRWSFADNHGDYWYLSKITDAAGFEMRFFYGDEKTGATVTGKKIQTISYPYGQGVSGPCALTFSYETRPDQISDYVNTKPIIISSRLTSITSVVSGNTVQILKLAYSSDGYRSRISSLSTVGKDGGTRTTSFAYNTYAAPSWKKPNPITSLSTYTSEPTIRASDLAVLNSGYPVDFKFIDVNADGLVDLIRNNTKTKPYTYQVRLQTSPGIFATEIAWFTYTDISYNFANTQNLISFADMNGDGKPDIILAGTGIFVHENTGTGFSQTRKQIAGLDFAPIGFGESTYLFDINGDGYADFVYLKQGKCLSADGSLNHFPDNGYYVYDWMVCLNSNGEKFLPATILLSQDDAYSVANVTYSTGGSANFLFRYKPGYNTDLVDINNDGLLDLVYSVPASGVSQSYWYSNESRYGYVYSQTIDLYARLNTGRAFDSGTPLKLTTSPVQPFFARLQGESAWLAAGSAGNFIDINNDGFPDFVFDHIEDGSSPAMGQIDRTTTIYAYLSTGKQLSNKTISLPYLGYSVGYNSALYPEEHICADNSIFLDLDQNGTQDVIYPVFSKWNTSTGYADVSFSVLYSAQSPLGGHLATITNEYGGTTGFTYAMSSTMTNTKLPFVFPVLSLRKQSSGIGPDITDSFSYSGGSYDYANRQFLGFSTVTKTDAAGNAVTTNYSQSDSTLGKPTQEQTSLSKTVFTYAVDTTAPYDTPLTSKTEYLGTAAKQTDYVYDSYGNVTQTIEYGDTAITGDELTTATDFAYNTSSYLVNMPSRVRMFSGTSTSGTLMSERQFLYDGATTYGTAPTNGNLTKERSILTTDQSYIEKIMTYDAFGNILTSTDPMGNTTTTAYDTTYNFFPTKITNPLGHVTSYSYADVSVAKSAYGKPSTMTDVNGNVTSYEYDGFGRQTKVTGPLDTLSTYGTQTTEYVLSSPGNSYTLTHSTIDSGTSNAVAASEIYDGLGRKIQTAQTAAVATLIRKSFSYDNTGKLVAESLPYQTTSGSATAYLAPDSSVKWTSYAYDALDRTTAITKPDAATVQTVYSNRTTMVTDENGHQISRAVDGLGRLILVTEKNGTENYTTSYRYDALGNLLAITDAANNKTAYSYDSLGRRLTMTDPDLGAQKYTYDLNSNILSLTDAAGTVVSNTYDALNRVTSQNASTTSGVDITYAYDALTSSNGIGRRTGMTDASGSASWQYDKLGRNTSKTVTIDGTAYVVSKTYNALGSVTSVTYPNKETVDLTYDVAGRLDAVEGACTSSTYVPSGQRSEITLPNGLVHKYSYDPNTLRLKILSAGALTGFAYTYDSVGNVTAITDSVLNTTKKFTYDALDRMLTGDGETYSYNAIGNILAHNGKIYSYGAMHPHAVISDDATTYGYDANGNMKYGNGKTFTWTYDNRPATISDANGTTSFVYNGDGDRVIKTVTANGETTKTLYIDELYEKQVTE